MVEAFIHGFILALGLILPLGVQNVFVFNQGALQSRLIQALPVVLTASLCDTLLIMLAVFGVSVAILGSFWLKTILMWAGLLFLLFMGWNTWKSTPADSSKQIAEKAFTPLKQIAFSTSVSLLNPHAILDTIGVIGTSSLSYTGSERIAFTAACIIVSWIWFILLALMGKLTGKLDPSGRLLRILNKGSALVMWGAAIYIGLMVVMA
ncbi:lysE type translocator family protein [Anoxybacillus sp. B7M1]|uniref:LysE/ArgO family amino acid transporter n=1 Tax=unclassified Anoxybacillus TaxID=2639704 RepID=UPI0005CC9D03|nr:MULTISPECIES: LysE/ArgO family amino acid transporter [unclassified Anoxybacillus]ANB56822.1 lysE type translocator family protein [Anoxybacillus sp. B2M1]ANB65550.1 lysE type translocator family protein [Anoxybacillus sp. B7M1]